MTGLCQRHKPQHPHHVKGEPVGTEEDDVEEEEDEDDVEEEEDEDDVEEEEESKLAVVFIPQSTF